MLKEQNKTSIELDFIEPQDNLVLETDELRFRQIMNNLVINAIKYTDQGIIHYGYEVHDRNIHFYVKDSGIGIKKEDQDKIFERFIKIEETGQEELFSGTGIGLSITKSLVELIRIF